MEEKLTNILNKIYGNVDNVIQVASVLLSVLSFIASIVCLVIGFSGEDEMLIIGFILLGSSVLCYLLYGFGEMIKQLKEINGKMK